ncbi:deoxyguanosinetriphosphate triphosphohydrolase family protein [Amycolatopsis suaedae]|uniref:DNTP triphosphohydrolase n=1 Tax=Amycolatopsis suaedae TaxID=2510978 RepID=A0A4Q7J7I2_9PSEU|nr:dNTP triphosphohydrolase [Amycolatopsis suaedae]RZQ62836.1 dNTP triphosphohydrolase [Amycolatopsis suaedae]
MQQQKNPQERRHSTDDHRYSRTEFERDRDRVLYSSAFRRLSGVTQVAAVSEQRVLHNRLTHSLKVAQIGRRLVQHVAKKQEPEFDRSTLDIDVVETAGLVHDIGHPPFGHAAEEKLNEILQSAPLLEGFEGNAQSFRVVTKLARRRMSYLGLDLTRATLDAVLKYPCTKATKEARRKQEAPPWTDRTKGEKWGAYRSEFGDFDFARSHPDDSRCLNAIAMDWADDITYATHDIEDYFRAGLIPLHNLEPDKQRILKHAAKRLGKRKDFDKCAFSHQLNLVVKEFEGEIKSACWDTRTNRVRMNELTSQNITKCIDAFKLTGDFAPSIRIDTETQYRVEALKELTWFYVIDRPSLAVMQQGQRAIIASLYEQLMHHLEKPRKTQSPPVQLRVIYKDIKRDNDFRDAVGGNKETIRARAVADYICLLTEAQAIDLNERLTGRSNASMFGTWFN